MNKKCRHVVDYSSTVDDNLRLICPHCKDEILNVTITKRNVEWVGKLQMALHSYRFYINEIERLIRIVKNESKYKEKS